MLIPSIGYVNNKWYEWHLTEPAVVVCIEDAADAFGTLVPEMSSRRRACDVNNTLSPLQFRSPPKLNDIRQRRHIRTSDFIRLVIDFCIFL